VPASFVEERRKAALKAYEAEEIPTWRRSGFWTTSLRGLDLDALEPKRYEPGLPQLDLGDDAHSALVVQRGANVVHTDLNEEGIVVMPLEQAVEEHTELVEQHFGKRLPIDESKFAAGTAAFWTGGVFIHVPKNVRVEKPIQVVWLIDEPGTAQWAHTLAVVGEHAEVRIREFFLGGDFEGQALHAGAFELYADTGAQVDLAHYQDWGRGDVYDLSTRRVEIRRDARVKWVPIHLGGAGERLTMPLVARFADWWNCPSYGMDRFAALRALHQKLQRKRGFAGTRHALDQVQPIRCKPAAKDVIETFDARRGPCLGCSAAGRGQGAAHEGHLSATGSPAGMAGTVAGKRT